MSDITDVVRALTELATQLRRKARVTGGDMAAAFHDAAGMVDAVMVGPAMQACLDALDAKVPPDVQYLDQDAAQRFAAKITGEVT